MAGATIQVGRQVRRIGLGIFAGCRHTMTRVAACCISHGAVIKRCWYKSASGMAGTTIGIGENMAINLAARERSIVTGRTVIHDAGVIKVTRYKSGRQVTHIAIRID